MANKKSKSLVTSWPARKKQDKAAATRGRKILSDSEPGAILVKYRGKRWCLLELLQHLSKRVYELERNQCVPSAKCLFEGQEYMENKHIGD